MRSDMAYARCGVIVLVWISTLVTQSEQGVLPKPRNHERHIIRNFNEGITERREEYGKDNRRYRKLSLEALRHYMPPVRYDAEGRHVLTRPRNDSDRKFNTMMNKIVQYKTEDENLAGLRTNPRDVFTSEDFEMMKKLVSELSWDHPHVFDDKKDNVLTVPKPVNNFYSLNL